MFTHKDRMYFTTPPAELRDARGSGRTFRMLQRALATALQGQTVFVLGFDNGDAKELLKSIYDQPIFKTLANVHVSMAAQDIQLPAGQLRFRGADSVDWDWRTGYFRGFPPGVPTFIDHYTWERELSKKETKDE